MDMYQIKQQSNDIQSLNAENELSLVTCIEDLSNEIFYEIFDYLDGCDIFDSFSNLNTHFHDLLNSSLLSLKFHRLSTSEQIFQNHYQRFIVPNKQHIVSLLLWHRPHINLFVNEHPIDSSFNRLESLILKNIVSKKLVLLCHNLSWSTSSVLIKYSSGWCSARHRKGLSNDFSIAFLKYHKLSILLQSTVSSFSLTHNQMPSNLQHLILNHSCTLNELLTLISCTPRLHRLVCKNLTQRRGDIVKEGPITLAQLTHVSVSDCSLQFDEFEIFINQICSQLQVLYIGIKAKDKAYLNASRWNRLICQHMLYLRKFNFEYIESINEMFQDTLYHPLSNLFTSSFWSEWRWFFEFVIYNRDMAKYSIHSYRSSYYEERRDATNDAYCNRYYNSSNLFIDKSRLEITESSIQSNLLTINSLDATQIGLAFEEIIRPFFSTISFTHLNVNYRDMSVVTLIELLQLVPHLDYLKISSIAASFSDRLSSEQAETFRLISNKNKITKIYINHLKDIAEADFIVDLCPHMEYLEIGCANNVDLELLVVCVLINQNINCIPHLRTLCVRVQNGNDNLIENLQEIINTEKLLKDFTINRMGNNIILQWK